VPGKLSNYLFLLLKNASIATETAAITKISLKIDQFHKIVVIFRSHFKEKELKSLLIQSILDRLWQP